MTIFRVHTTDGQADIYGCITIRQALTALDRMLFNSVDITQVECLVDENDWMDVTLEASIELFCSP